LSGLAKFPNLAVYLISLVTFSGVIRSLETELGGAAPYSPSVEQERRREDEGSRHQGRADAREGAHGADDADDGSTGQLAQRVRQVAYGDDGRPNARIQASVELRQVHGVEDPPGQASEPESAKREAPGQREGERRAEREGERTAE
jgi:hypothetical protein